LSAAVICPPLTDNPNVRRAQCFSLLVVGTIAVGLWPFLSPELPSLARFAALLLKDILREAVPLPSVRL